VKSSGAPQIAQLVADLSTWARTRFHRGDERNCLVVIARHDDAPGGRSITRGEKFCDG
jgi:hypothetical protein